MSNAEIFAKLEPQIVWKHFQTLCDIPRPSKQETQIIQYLKNWAEQQQLDYQTDNVGNLVIKKPATKGMENVKTVILQAHVDMVTQANLGSTHNFLTDAIQVSQKDDWLIAENTTLGADNGIGVALALAVLESTDIPHGNIEVLLTVDEEAGMSGARLLDNSILQGEWLFNMDTEEWGELYLGCAGSQDIEISQTVNMIDLPHDMMCLDIHILGLQGGHSGVDIHLNRANANVILSRILADYFEKNQAYLLEFKGGTGRNAIAREAVATIAIAPQDFSQFQQYLQHAELFWKNQYPEEKMIVKFTANQKTHQQYIDLNQQNWLKAIAECPYGVAEMSQAIENLVHLSNNIGIVKLSQYETEISIMVRSMHNADTAHFVEKIQQHFEKFVIFSNTTGLISSWTPNPNSKALHCLQQAYQHAFNINPTLKVIHAGLECGIIAKHYPHLEMVSFGPDIRGAHAPAERVSISSVAKCWKLLTTALSLVDKK